MKKSIYILLLTIPLLFSFGSIRGQQPSLLVDVPAVVTLDETFRLVFTATGKAHDFTPPQFESFNVLAGPSTSTNSSSTIINGKRSDTYEITYMYILQAKEVGKFTIPSASVKIGGNVYESKSVVVEVVKESASSNSANTANRTNGIGEKDLMLQMSVNKKNVVKGEPVIVSIKLLSRSSLSGFEDVKFPTFNGFWSQEIETPNTLSFSRETFDGRIYDAALVRKYMLLPQQTGTLTIDPAEMVCLVQIRENKPSRSIFDDFFDSYQTLRKRISTPKININVTPLPAGAPNSFTGGVGEFKMDVKLTRDSLKAHEAASVVVTISGTGNLNMIEAPTISFPPDFEAYDIKRSDKIASGSTGNTGTKTFEYPFIPRSSGSFELEAVDFSFYSISKGKYITLSSGKRQIEVARGDDSGATIVSSGVNKQAVKSLGDDIRYIATDGSTLKIGNKYLISSLPFWLVVTLIVALFFIASIILKKSYKRRADVAGMKNRKAMKVAKFRLKNAESFLKQNLYTAFYEEMHKAILGYISDKFTMPLSELNKENIGAKLNEKGVAEEAVNELFEVLDACEYARYAPSSGFTAMENHYKMAINVISVIES